MNFRLVEMLEEVEAVEKRNRADSARLTMLLKDLRDQLANPGSLDEELLERYKSEIAELEKKA